MEKSKQIDVSLLPEIMTLKQVAKFLGLSTSQMRKLCVVGEMPHRRIRASYRVARCDLEEYMEICKCPAKTKEPRLIGVATETYTKSSGTNKDGANAAARLQATLQQLSASSPNYCNNNITPLSLPSQTGHIRRMNG